MNTELILLNYLLSTKNWSIIAENAITKNMFKSYKSEFEYLENYYNSYSSLPDEHTLLGVFPDFEILEVNSPISAILDEFYLSYAEGEVAETFNDAREFFIKGSYRTDHNKFYSKINKLIDKLNGISISSQAVDCLKSDSIFELLEEKFLARQSDLSAYFYPTGFDNLDKWYIGWNKDNDFVIIAGRPGTGKSMLACALAAEQMIRGKRVLYYDGEMDPAQTIERMICHLTGIDQTPLKKGAADIQERYFKELEFWKDYIKDKLFFATKAHFNNRYPTTKQLEALCLREKVDVLFIDQLNLIEDIEKAKGYEKFNNISKQIKLLRDTLNIPVITVHEQNRPPKDSDPSDVGTADLAGADGIGADASKVIFLTEVIKSVEENKAPSKFIKSEPVEPDPVKIITVSLAKTRDGARNIHIPFAVDMGKCQFIEAESRADLPKTKSDMAIAIEQKVEENKRLVKGIKNPERNEIVF